MAKPKATCPYCGRKFGLTKLGKLPRHLDRSTGRYCGRSGGRPN
jgi:hypothetical protein